MQRKKWIPVLCIVLLLACQPTPSIEVISQKDTETLIQTVLDAQTNTPEQEAKPAPIAEQMPDRFCETFTTDAQQITVIADAPIRILCETVFPIVRVERRAITVWERMTVLQRLFQVDTLYRFTEDHATKEDLARRIAGLMEEPTPEEKAAWLAEDVENTEETWEDYLAERTAVVRDLQEQYRILPDDAETVLHPAWDGSVSWNDRIYIVADLNAQYLNYKEIPYAFCNGEESLTWQAKCIKDARAFNDTDKEGSVRIEPDAMDRPFGNAVITPQQSAEIALSLFDGIADYAVCEVLWSNDADADGQFKGVSSAWAYTVRLTPRVLGAVQLYDPFGAEEHSADDAYMRSWNYENAIVSIDGNGAILGFYWTSPHTVKQIVSETTPLLPFAEISDLFGRQINRNFGTAEYRNDTLTVDRVTLGLFRMREKNRIDTGLLVPVWRFSGRMVCDTYPNLSYMDNLLLINAIDGTIIDPNNGY